MVFECKHILTKKSIHFYKKPWWTLLLYIDTFYLAMVIFSIILMIELET